ncbi:unnamed protein product [Tenebrio molitor]|nr:unnamed protein product [Tenebrio molitor]
MCSHHNRLGTTKESSSHQQRQHNLFLNLNVIFDIAFSHLLQ